MSDEVEIALALPPEVWGEIATYLDAAELKKLDHLGNRRLRQCLRRGVYSVTYNNLNGALHTPEWPSAFLSQYPKLESLTIRRRSGFGHSSFPLQPKHFESLPTLLKLDLSAFLMDFQDTQWNQSKTEKMLTSLPSSLTWLSLPTFDMRDRYTVFLPRGLTYLALKRSHLTSPGLASLPAHLLHLDLGYQLGESLSFAQVLPELEELEVKEHGTHTEEVILALPSHIVRLHLDMVINLSYGNIKSLSQTLQVLRLAKTCIFDNGDHPRISFPPTITDLEIGSLDSKRVAKDFLGHLPQVLTAFRLNDARHVKPSWLQFIPHTVTVLTLQLAELLDAGALEALPNKLKELTLTGILDENQGWVLQLPPTVTHLTTTGDQTDIWWFFPEADEMLPPNLIRWTSKWHQSPRHPFSYLNLYEKPTVARAACQLLANSDPYLILPLLGTSFACLLSFRNMSIVLPHVVGIFLGIFTKSHDFIVRTGVKLYQKL